MWCEKLIVEKVNKRRLVICWYGKGKVSKKILSDKRERGFAQVHNGGGKGGILFYTKLYILSIRILIPIINSDIVLICS